MLFIQFIDNPSSIFYDLLDNTRIIYSIYTQFVKSPFPQRKVYTMSNWKIFMTNYSSANLHVKLSHVNTHTNNLIYCLRIYKKPHI